MAGDLASTNKSLRSRQTSNGDAKDKLPPAASPRLGATAWGTISAIQSESRSTVIPNGVKEGERSKLTYPPSSISDMSDRGLSSMRLELSTGISFQGYSFGASIPVSGELVFQTGMVGYPESMTDPSYRGQILVITFPLVGNYGVPSMQQKDAGLNDINSYFESKEIHIAGLVVSTYSNDFSHYLAAESLSSLLKRHNVPAVYGIDTRALTKLIRTQGSVLGRLHLEDQPVRWQDQNTKNLVKEVYTPDVKNALKHPSGRTVRVLCLDVGMVDHECFVHRGMELKVVPWDFDFLSEKDYDGLFISNGPGDPATMVETIANLKRAIEAERTPIFGICLGNQLLARAAGAGTLKMKFGNRGQNIPCTNLISGRCYVTSQNHGFAVDGSSLPPRWNELFVNANDGSNEGIFHETLPYFSVQFHPESAPGPRDTEFLFDVFIDSVLRSARSGKLEPILMPGGKIKENHERNPRLSVQKVLILGSGGLSIGQAGEFDYSGSQAIKALKEEGIYTVLVNPNIATIQTSKGLADKVYYLPVNAEFVRKVIKFERPDAIYVTFGGQTALNVGIQLRDEFEALGVRVLGTPIDAIITTEDRELFARSMRQIGEKCAKSATASNVGEALKAVRDIGFPIIIRAAYALGGLGSGFADNEEELVQLCNKAFAVSPQVLLERSMKGWKEIEYEVVRDCQDNCITVCNMENFDPLGIHTGDSIVVAPSQTLSDADYNMLRTTAVNVIRHLGIIGECNIQYALNPFSQEYCIIEVNARLSRSSALASKATGYPLAFIAAKLGLGIPVNEIPNSVTKVTSACFEPSLDYVVVKIPRWDLKKFTRVSTLLSSSMKSVGEVMSIGRTFEEAIQKAIRAIDFHNLGFNQTDALMSIDQELQTPSDQRLFAIANAMSGGYSVDKIWEMTKIDKWFLSRLMGLITMGQTLSQYSAVSVPSTMIRQAKQMGFADRQLAMFFNSNEMAVRRIRLEAGIVPFVKQIDTVAAEFPAHTNYLYITYNACEHDITFEDQGIMVLGSGVYRIGSSVEFDWCAVRTVRTLRSRGIKTVMVNYNPETVSTDYDEADRLYFENIDLEGVLDIYDAERSSGVIICMGGQTPNNIALPLHRLNVKILGTSPEMVDNAENRYKFSRMLDQIGVDQPAWKELTSIKEATEFCEKVTYPVLVRPSYVLSGAAMNTVYSQDDLATYLQQAVEVSRQHPVVITKYIENAKEIEMDAVAKDGKMLMHFVSEHVENAGVHSGDATLILPPQDLDPETVRRIEVATQKIGDALNVTGPYNIQFIAKDNEIKVIECNVRASRSFPFVSKVMGFDLIELATDAILNFPVTSYPPVNIPKDYVGVKVPQFSFPRLSGADPVLGVEMASTGEVACFGKDKYEAYIKALISTGFQVPNKNILLSIGSFKEKMEMVPSVKTLHRLGYNIYATAGTADFIREHEIPVSYLEILADEEKQKSEFSLTQHLANNLIDLYINLPSSNRFRRPSSYVSKGYRTRRMAVDYSVPLVTNVKCAKLLIEAIARNFTLDISPLDCQTSHRTVSLPGLINIAAFVPEIAKRSTQDVEAVTKASIMAGFTTLRLMPVGVPASITDARALGIAQANSEANAFCDYNFSVAATADNALQLSKLTADVGSLFIPFNFLSGNINKVAAVTSHFTTWPSTKPIITDARTTDLASILLLASLHGRPVHITSVTSKDDISLIALGKSKRLQVTCDVAVYAFFLCRDDNDTCTYLPTKEDQDALWSHLDVIDCFSIGTMPYQAALDHQVSPSSEYGIADTLPLLFKAVVDGKLTIDDIVSRFYDNPKRIFDLPDQPETYVEVEIDRLYNLPAKKQWSAFNEAPVAGAVKRVVFKGQSVCLDGKIIDATCRGEDMSHARTSGRSHSIASMKTVSSPKQKSTMEPGLLDLGLFPRLDSRDARTNGIFGTLSKQESYIPQLPSIQRQIISSPFLQRHIISVDQISRDDLHLLFTVAQEMRLAVKREGVTDILRGRVLCTLFYEPSTRTSASFDAAMQRLGGRTIPITVNHSSVMKGESLADTVRTLSCYGDALVIRHPSEDSAREAAKFSPVPIINGGNGSMEHPTQAFLDLFTIREELGTVNGLVITFVGDLKYGRTVHSLVKLLQYYSVQVRLVSPKQLSLPGSLVKVMEENGMLQAQSHKLTPEILARTDVLYCTRVQKERFDDATDYERLKDSFVVDNAMLKFAKQQMIVMHPLPRNAEISLEVDFDQRAAYFRQMRYGLYVRMALLALVMGPK